MLNKSVGLLALDECVFGNYKFKINKINTR